MTEKDREQSPSPSLGGEPRQKRRPVARRVFLGLVTAFVVSFSAGAGYILRKLHRHRPFGMKMEFLGHIGARLRYGRLPLAEAIPAYFDYLDLDADGVKRFVRDYGNRVRRRDAFHPLEEIMTVYLMSTDFFSNGADESRRLRYVALWDPYISPCFNPFAKFE